MARVYRQSAMLTHIIDVHYLVANIVFFNLSVAK